MRQGPLAGRYGAVATMAISALVPYLVLSAAVNPLARMIMANLHMSEQTLSLALGLGNAGYAVGTVLAVLLAQHLPQRLMLVVYATMLVVGSVMAAAAQSSTVFIIGHILQGLSTSLMLIAAVPPLALSFGREKLRSTAVILSLCIFGAVALGPTIGGIQAAAHEWRPLFWIVAGVAAAALLLTLATYEHTPPANRNAPRDPLAVTLSTVGSVAAFYGASELTSHKFVSAIVLVPLLGGLALILLLVAYQSRARNPLLPIGMLLKSTIPMAGCVIALAAAAASISASDLTANLLLESYSPLHVGLLYLPEFAGALITAIALGYVLETKAMQYLPLIGMVFLAAGIGVFLIKLPATEASTLIGSGLTGVGLGATVAPALFGAGFSLPAANLQRVFAVVELLRGVAAFMVAPLFAHLALTVGGSVVSGTRTALWIGLAVALGGLAVTLGVYFAGGARPETPDLTRFLGGQGAAWHSPPLLARLRGRSLDTDPSEEPAPV